ncbi:MAG: PDDEXK nuclease domain-containing protein [Armatimonadota bacterium]
MNDLTGRHNALLPAGYAELLESLKTRIHGAQVRAALAANRELINLYWEIGKELTERLEQERWGSSIIEQVAQDLQEAFPGMAGFSPRNLRYMRNFYLMGREDVILQQSVAKLPWGHIIMLLEKCHDREIIHWYAQQALEHGWSRNILALQITSALYDRQGKAITNFAKTLPPPQSDLAQQVLKDPYIFDFLTLGEAVREREIEEQLTGHVIRFLLELGAGFALVGRQVHLDVAGQDYYLDLLFYHTRLHCYVVVELKSGEFRPEDAGKLNFYLSAVDDQMRAPADQPTIGMLLCRGKRKLVVEYALRDLAKPIGVADWQTQLLSELPADLRPALPTVEEFEAELQAFTDDEGSRE